MSWKTLMKMMTDKYCPQNEIRKLEMELWELEVKGTNLASYTQCFQELALLCGRMFSEESDKVDKYVGGLPDMIHGRIVASKQKTMQEAIEIATELMDKKRGTGSSQKLGCYECGVQGHFRRECPKLKNNNNHGNQGGRNNALARVYATGRAGTDPDVNHYGICLANNQKFNFSKYILDNLKKNLEAGVPFYMFPRAVTPLFDTMMVQAIEEVGDLATAEEDTPIPDAPSSSQPQRKHKPRRKEKTKRKETEVSPTELPTEEHVPTPFSDPLPSGEDSMPLKELMVLCTNLLNKVLDIENEVIEMKSSRQAKIEVVYYKLGEIIQIGEEITDINADAEVNLENVYNLDLAHEEIVLSMHDATDANGKKVTEEMVESTTRTASSKAHVKDKGKAKLVEEPKVLKSRKAQIAIDEEVAKRIEDE
nr:reverse transcriptase domain-containing protein [Tanacetum cinerariifolium]